MKKATIIFLMIFLSGCSGVPYAPKGTTMYQGGYSDKKVGEGQYIVTFEGNAYNTILQITDFVKKRASELCAPSGFDASFTESYRPHTEMGFAGGMVYTSQHQFPTVEAKVKCK